MSNIGLHIVPWTKPGIPADCQPLGYQGHLPKGTHGALMTPGAVAAIVKHVPPLGIADLAKRGWRKDFDADYCLGGRNGQRLVLLEHPCGYQTVELFSPDEGEPTRILSYLWFGQPLLLISPTDAAQLAEEVYFHFDSRMCLSWHVYG